MEAWKVKEIQMAIGLQMWNNSETYGLCTWASCQISEYHLLWTYQSVFCDLDVYVPHTVAQPHESKIIMWVWICQSAVWFSVKYADYLK